MKFRATFRSSPYGAWTALLAALAKFRKSVPSSQSGFIQSLCKITPEKVLMILRHLDAMEVYLELQTIELFEEGYILASRRENCIGFAIDIDCFYEALRCGTDCPTRIVKLSKRDKQAVLSFEFRSPAFQTLSIIQDCPIQIQSGDSLEELVTPDFPACEWNVELPSIRRFVNVFERMKKLGSTDVSLTIHSLDCSSSLASINLISNSDVVMTQTLYTGCHRFVQSPSPQSLSITRHFKLKRIIAALKLASDTVSNKGFDSSAIAAMPEDGSKMPWMCLILTVPSSIESLRVFCVIPSQWESTEN